MTGTLRDRRVDPLVSARSAVELADRRKLRAVTEAAQQGRTQRDIAAKLGVTQAAVYKTLVRARHSRDLSAGAPREIVLRYATGEIPRTALLEALVAYPWSRPQVHDRGNPLPQQIAPGSAVELERAVVDGIITDEDYEAVVARIAR